MPEGVNLPRLEDIGPQGYQFPIPGAGEQVPPVGDIPRIPLRLPRPGEQVPPARIPSFPSEIGIPESEVQQEGKDEESSEE